VGVVGVIVVLLEIETWVEVVLKVGVKSKVEWRIGMGPAEFCGTCVYLGVFLLLWWRVIASGIAGSWGVYG
jgi:hypothetical protein